jgi:hypothetical protein
MTDLRNSKQSTIEVLQLWSSRDEQLEYKRTVPIADVSAELFCMWSEVFWPSDAELRAEFTETEWAALQRFHSVFERTLCLLPHHPLPPIEEFILSPHWLILSRAAERALAFLDTSP